MGRKIRYILLLMLLPFVGFSQYNSIFTCENCRLYNYIPNGVAGYVLTSNGDSIAPSFQVSTTGIYYIYFLYQESVQTTAPVVGACAPVLNIAVMTLDFKNSAFLLGNELTQSILPATRTTAKFTVIITPPFIGVY